MRGNFNSNGMHNDAKILKYIVDNNVRGIKDTVNYRHYLFILDRGFQELYDLDFLYDFLMPSLSRAKPVSCFEANISRLATRTRFVNEKVYGDVGKIFPISKKQVIGQHKRYINSWSAVLHGALNYIHPNGSITNTKPDYENSIRWCIGTKFFKHLMRNIVNTLDHRTIHTDHRWYGTICK